MLAWLASACAVAALFLTQRRRQALQALNVTPFRPGTPQHRCSRHGAQLPRLADDAWLRAEAPDRIPAMLAQIAASPPGPPDLDVSCVYSRDEPCRDCPRSGLEPAGDDEPPPGFTTRYSAEVRSFATYRDLYQPD